MRHNHRLTGLALVLVLAAGCSDSTDASPTPSMGISIASTNISVPRGQSLTFPITVSRSGGFSGAVLVAVTGLPQDLSVGCNPASVLGNTCTLTVAAGASQALGGFTATVKATGSGVATKTILLTITVTQ